MILSLLILIILIRDGRKYPPIDPNNIEHYEQVKKIKKLNNEPIL